MYDIQVFHSPMGDNVRVLVPISTSAACEPLFCANDVAKALKYANPKDAVNTHCKKDGLLFHTLVDAKGRRQKTKCISEGNLYRLIMRSKLPSAVAFQDWVCDEVLPSIRKHKTYSITHGMKRKINKLIDMCIELNEKNIVEVAISTPEYDRIKIKVSPEGFSSSCSASLTTTEIAQYYGESAQWLNTILKDHNIQRRSCGDWKLEPDYDENGYITMKNGTRKWTPKGIQFIHDILADDGIFPIY